MVSIHPGNSGHFQGSKETLQANKKFASKSPVHNFFFHPVHGTDKKKRAVATNVALTLLTAGAWQVPFLAVNLKDRHDIRQVETEAKSDSTPSPKEKEIEEFVVNFMAPYISGQTTKENENPERAPLINQIYDNVFSELTLTSAEKDEIQKTAYRAFLEESVKAFSVLKKGDFDTGTYYEGDYRQMLPVITGTLKKDFPSLTINQEQLKADVAKAIESPGENDKLILEEVNRNLHPKNPMRQDHKEALIERMNVQGVLFTADLR